MIGLFGFLSEATVRIRPLVLSRSPPHPTPPRGHSRLADASPRRAQVPGSVPFLKGVVPAYTGEMMAPFTQNIFTAPTAL